ncbi:MAG: hypothetical protein IKI94_11625 [Ruminococcus sp.]|nr:hypothetical protein [Ruminococcus sp.]
MGYNKEMARNLVLLKKCRRIHSTTFYIFLVGGIMFIIYAFLNSAIFAWEWLYAKTSITSPSGVVIAVIIDALIVAPLAFFFAYRASIKLHDLCAVWGILLETANLILMIYLKSDGFFKPLKFAFYVASLYSVLGIITLSFNLWANIVYHKLEEAEGFPHFNERFTEYEEEKLQRKIMDKYEISMRERMKTSTDTMGGVDYSNDILEENISTHKSDMMDSI